LRKIIVEQTGAATAAGSSGWPSAIIGRQHRIVRPHRRMRSPTECRSKHRATRL